MKKYVFIGSRTHVYKSAISLGLNFEKVFALKGSYLEKELLDNKIYYEAFSVSDKEEVLINLINSEFDILISNGCPIIFPVNRFKKNQVLINIHPTYLPHLQGKTPLNGVFYLNYEFYGATMHFIDDGIDTGNIIHQKKVSLTPDLDLGLIYHLSMELEGEVFREGWQLLTEKDFVYSGIPQPEGKTYFNRTIEKQSIDFITMNTELILKKIRSFGIESQGCYAQFGNKKYKIFGAEEVVHQPLLEKVKQLKPSSVYLEYDNKILVKTKDGLIKLNRFKSILD